MMFGKDLQLFYRQWHEQLDQGIGHWQTMVQTQAHSLDALLSTWRQGLDGVLAGWAETVRLGGNPSPLLQPWTQAVVQWLEGYAEVASTVLTGRDVTAHRQVAHLTEHITELADVITRMDQRLESLHDHQTRMALDTDHFLQRLQGMQEALAQRLSAFIEHQQATEATRQSPPSRSTTRRRLPSE
jgi:hypothetical protein